MSRLRLRFYSSLFAIGCLGVYVVWGGSPTGRMACAVLAVIAFAEFLSDVRALLSESEVPK